ncbi:MAG TPA: hypothetical protein VFT43_07325 [Candidatus Polarisedimenticolia bacterium]|nr:hypothetical protein [Candidatus Polarisedimenticolia bacterium]
MGLLVLAGPGLALVEEEEAMNDHSRAALVMAKAVYVYGQIEAMKQANRDRLAHAQAPAYPEEAFDDVIGSIRGDIVHQFLVGNLDHL